jgi:hypothetical protein
MNNNTGIDWGAIATSVLTWLLPIVITALAVFIGDQVRRLTPSLIAKYQATFSVEQQKLIESVARVAVSMAEQVAKRDDIKQAAEEKRLLAYGYIDRTLSQHGITLKAQDIWDLIESAVHQEINKDKLEEVIQVTTGDVHVDPPEVEIGGGTITATEEVPPQIVAIGSPSPAKSRARAKSKNEEVIGT